MTSPNNFAPGISAAWRALADRRAVADRRMTDLFAADPQRVATLSASFGDIFLDYSKHRVVPETMELLRALARAAGLDAAIKRMFGGEKINISEQRAVLHVALREQGERKILVDGADVMPGVRAVLAQMRRFAGEVRDGRWRGHTGKPIADVVHIGIGGSMLGPQMACLALAAGGPRVHFVSNVDGAQLAGTLRNLDPATTLFIVASKSFTTQETMANAASARSWTIARLGDARAVARHFVAPSTNTKACGEFGIPPENMFAFWDWVGGRYSMWSAIGLPIALAAGMDQFDALRAGAYAMDQHFQEAPLEQNLPVILALLGVWYANVLGAQTYTVVPYDQRLARLPAWLQQVDMESNGKSVGLDGKTMAIDTGPIALGEPGSDAQHSYFQLVHQGTRLIPVDFLIAAEADHGLPGHHEMLVSNCFAQSEALMRGRDEAEVRKAMAAAGAAPDFIDRVAVHRTFPGNRPSSTILYRRLDAKTLGALLAMYEHKVFVQGVIWGINSFDQWGVELGKELANKILPELTGTPQPAAHDASTAGLIARWRALAGRA
jgi:glucose-6-phosphate isomerase